ncbi:MAG: TraR/DksA C4-type zinc finger protein [Campylobacterales bacterium]|nr:TraR/DksA C4-type zinc finger protein [Campylobacterales bacterium]
MEKIDYKEFEKRLLEMKEELESNIARLKDEIDAIGSEDEIDDLEDLASLESDNMHHTAILKQQQHELDEVIHALSKIKTGNYGICEKSGDEIPLERLRAMPHARYCIKHAQSDQE